MKSSSYPMVLYPHPIYLKFGGKKLFDLRFQKQPDLSQKLAEVWSIADLNSHSSVVANGKLAGKSLSELIKDHPEELLGKAQLIQGKFPLMIRLLDINEALPPAVHPDHDYAKKAGIADPGKYETAYVLECEPGATFYTGLREGISPSNLLEYVQQNKSFDTMNAVKVKAGETYNVPAGKLHAWGPGSLLFELHTVSNSIFALDWMDWQNKDAARREFDQNHLLHCLRSELKDSGRISPIVIEQKEGKREVLFASDHYTLEKLETEGKLDLASANGSFSIYTVIDGSGKLSIDEGKDEFQVSAYSTILVPAKSPQAWIEARNGGKLTVLKSYI